ncbi:MAG: TonB-dependent siderophore receptor, partial [Verrucomicrobiaceae bacterium]
LSSAAMAQSAVPEATAGQTLPPVTVKDKADPRPEAKADYQALTSTIGKGKQALRDIPQSVTVVTEKLIDDRNLDTLKDVLKNTGGITFLAAEGGEEDIRLRGFSLAGTGDIFVDGIRDPAFYDRDTFNYDRVEVLRGSASMLFGRGSTGGAVNQVSKSPFLMDSHEVSTTLGNHEYRRVTGDFNLKTSDNAALRINAMVTKADNNGAGSSLDKNGLAAAYRWGIGTKDEFQVSLYHLDNDNGINYGLPWIRPTASANSGSNTLLTGLKPSAYYGLASDYNAGSANLLTLSHVHRFSPVSELKTTVRQGKYKRDQRASTIRFCTFNATTNPICPTTTPTTATLSPNTILTRGNNVKVQDMDVVVAQTDYSSKFNALGVRHELITGLDYADESKTVYTLSASAAKPRTTLGTPDDGRSIDEGARARSKSSDYSSKAWGAYVQDLVQVAPDWKVLAGLRFDKLSADYRLVNSATPYDQDISEWSRRFGVLYQPSPIHSFHLSYGTSFNTSGDTYSYAGANEAARVKASNTPPESSENLEIGAKLDSEDGRFTTRLAVFRSVKKNERNTDATSVSGDSYLLSGKRHSTGFEIDFAGRPTPKWEIYASYMWLPVAKVDEAASTSFGNRKGDRPGLTPKHSGTVWNTYQVTSNVRLGAGVNFRSRQSPADVSVSPANPVWQVPSYHTIDLMAEYIVNQTFTVKGNLSNVEDKLYSDSLYRGHYIPGAGRLFQVELVAKF